MQKADAFTVHFGAVERNIGTLQQKLRQHSRSAPHLQYIASSGERSGYPARYVFVRQEMLPQRLLRPYFLHNLSATSEGQSYSFRRSYATRTLPGRDEKGEAHRYASPHDEGLFATNYSIGLSFTVK